MATVARRGSAKLSRRKKKYWRKGVNLDDLEQSLDNHRQEERAFGGPLVEKKDSDLFFIGTKATDLNATVAARKRRHKQVITASVDESKYVRGQFKLKDKSKLMPPLTEPKTEPHIPVSYDMWGAAPDKTLEQPDVYQWDPAIEDYELRYLRKKPVNTPRTKFHKPSLLPAIDIPVPGMSYNPSYSAHQKLLYSVHNEEVDKLEKDKQLDKLMPPRISQRVLERNIMTEMAEGLFDNEEEDIETGMNIVTTESRLDKKVSLIDDKTDLRMVKKRKKRKLAAEMKRFKMEAAKMMKQKQNDVFRIRGLKAEVEKAFEKSATSVAKTKKRKLMRKVQTHKNSAHPFENAPTVFKLPDELCGSVRLLKPEGSIMFDHYKSLQKRNIIECRVRTSFKRKYKPKRYETRSGKAVTLESIPI